MKKSIYCGLILAAFSSIVGCTKENGLLPAGNAETVVLSLNTPNTRTSLKEDKKIYWNTGDRINVNGMQYFVNVDDKTGAATVEVVKADTYTAVFPAANFDAANSTLTLPQAQSYDFENNETDISTFGPAANPMVAYSTTNSLNFRSICGTIKLTVVNANQDPISIGKIEISDNDGGNIAGTFTLTGIETGTPTLSGGDNSSVYINPSCDLEPGASNDFYIVIPNNQGNTLYQKGFTVKIFSEDGDVETRSSVDNTVVKASEVVKMPAIDFLVTQQTVYYKVDGAAQWDETFPSAVTSSLSVKTAEGSIMKKTVLKQIDDLLGAAEKNIDLDFEQADYAFDSFNYTFTSKDKIRSIVFPANILAISDFSFYSSLEKIVIPEKVTEIESFYYCSNLGTIICKGITPPVVAATGFWNMGEDVPEADRKIFVPNETALQAYKTAPEWSDLVEGISWGFSTFQFLVGTGN